MSGSRQPPKRSGTGSSTTSSSSFSSTTSSRSSSPAPYSSSTSLSSTGHAPAQRTTPVKDTSAQKRTVPVVQEQQQQQKLQHSPSKRSPGRVEATLPDPRQAKSSKTVTVRHEEQPNIAQQEQIIDLTVRYIRGKLVSFTYWQGFWKEVPYVVENVLKSLENHEAQNKLTVPSAIAQPYERLDHRAILGSRLDKLRTSQKDWVIIGVVESLRFGTLDTYLETQRGRDIHFDFLRAVLAATSQDEADKYCDVVLRRWCSQIADRVSDKYAWSHDRET